MGSTFPTQEVFQVRTKDSPLLGDGGAIRGFLRHRSELSEQTKLWYAGCLARYATWLEHRGTTPVVGAVNMDNAEQYIEERREHVKVSSTRCDAIVLKSFGQYIGRRIYRSESPVADLRVAQPDDSTRRPLTNEELSRLMAVSKKGPEGRRNYAVVMTAAGCGLRLGELTALWTGDILLDVGELVVQGRTSKSKKTRKVAMPDETIDALDDYLSDREGESPVFLTRLNKAFHKQGMSALFRALSREADIPDLSAHTLRHTWATNFVRAQSGDFTELTRSAGWTDKQNRMAMRYVHERPLAEKRKSPSVFSLLEGGRTFRKAG